MSQTNYTLDQPIAVAGLLGDIGENYVRSYKPSVQMPFGVLAVLSGTVGDVAALPTTTGDVTTKAVGVTVFSQNVVNDGTPGYPANGQTANVVRSGAVWVKVEESVNAEDPAFVRFAGVGPLIQLGAFRKSADAGSVALPGLKFLSSAVANGFALLFVNL